jgi:hypothetical protein
LEIPGKSNPLYSANFIVLRSCMRYERGKIKQLERNHPHFKGMLKMR